MASISGSILGDERTDSYFFCKNCRVYTVEVFWDLFDGMEESHIQGPIPEAEGTARIRLIEECATPWDKRCRCWAHQAYFEDALD